MYWAKLQTMAKESTSRTSPYRKSAPARTAWARNPHHFASRRSETRTSQFRYTQGVRSGPVNISVNC